MSSPAARCLTFYSYKGGTGRTMALANVAWILASNGYRVLAIDWDLEAPGLHRYFHPLLVDPELTASPGVIDLVSDFVEAAVGPAEAEEDERWYESFTDLREYAVAVSWKFPAPGRLDLVPAGRQGPTYAARVNAFDWQYFYEELSGGAFLEAVKARTQEHYDFILIDSRTGVSDTAGICTVQLPDTLVACFTANRQSIEGTVAVVHSVRAAWNELPADGPTRRIFPVPTRIELGEKERLDGARQTAQATFQPFLDHLTPDARRTYWDHVETLYYPYYAYEEVLAVFGDRPGQSKSLLSSVEQLTRYLTDGAVASLLPPTEEERTSVLRRLLRSPPTPQEEAPAQPAPERRYRAFVSSTRQDLHAHRTRAIQTLTNTGLLVIAEEHLGAKEGDPLQKMRELVRQCDLFVLLVAWRRGYIPPGATQSVVQLEYRTAREAGRDICVFLLDETTPWPPHFIESVRDPRFDPWRRELLRNHVVSMFGSVDSLHLQLLQRVQFWLKERQASPQPAGLPTDESLHGLKGWLEERQAATFSPNQVPPPPADFVGRDDLLTALEALCSAATSPVTLALTGLAGAGKTALACKFAEQLAARFPDGRLFLVARSTTRFEVMTHVCRSLRPDDTPPRDEAELEGQYRAALAGKRVLLILDDVEGERLQNLSVEPGCVALLTSRQWYSLPGLNTHIVESLRVRDAIELLRTAVPRLSEGEAYAIALACGALPLALRLAGSFLAERVGLSVGHFLERWGETPFDERTGLAGLTAALRRSEEMLPEPLRREWYALSVFVGGVEAAWAATIWECDRCEAEERLATLSKQSLVAWDADRAHYRLHPVVRDYTQAQLDSTARAEIEQRHRAFCLNELEEVETFYRLGAEAIAEALRRFDRVWPEIQAAFTRSRGQSDPESQRFLVAVVIRATSPRALRQHPRERIEWSKIGVDAARTLGNRKSEVRALGEWGTALAAVGQARQAQQVHHEQLSLAGEIGDRQAECCALGNLGTAHALVGELQEAVKLHQQQLAMARAGGDRELESQALCGFGVVSYQRGELARANEYFQSWLSIARETGDRSSEADALAHLGQGHAALGQLLRARELLEESRVIARELGDRRGEAAALRGLGRIYANLGQPQHAAESHQHSLDLCRAAGNQRGEAAALNDLGSALAALGRLQEARQCHQQALEIAQATGNRRCECRALGYFGDVERQLGQPQQAVPVIEQALELARTLGDRRAESQQWGLLGLAGVDLGRLPFARDCFQHQMSIAHTIGDRQGEAYASWNLGLVLQQSRRLEDTIPLLEANVAYQKEVGHAEYAENAARVAGFKQSLERTRPDPADEILGAIAARTASAAELLQRYRLPEYDALWHQHVELYRTFAKRLIAQGNPALALELIRDGLKAHANDADLEYCEALALLRAGNIARAQEKAWGLLGREDLPVRVQVDALCLYSRSLRDAYQRERDPERKQLLASQAAEHYERAFEIAGDLFSATTAATLSLLAGDVGRSRALAQRVVERGLELSSQTADYSLSASLGEACLLLGDVAAASGHYRQALHLAGNDHGNVAAMRRQLQLLQPHLPENVAGVLELFHTLGSVVVFSGHHIDSPRDSAASLVRFPPSPALEAAVRATIRQELDRLSPLVGYCAPSCGADLLFAEALLERGCELHVVLPFDLDDFFQTRVDYGQDSMKPWRKRCEAVLQRAEVHLATYEEFLDDEGLYEFADRFMQGLALGRAEQLGAEAQALLVLDFKSQHSSPARLLIEWQQRGGPPAHIIDLETLRHQVGIAALSFGGVTSSRITRVGKREVRAMLFADAKNFSKLPERKMPEFFLAFLRQVGDVIKNLQVAPLFSNTWGDGLYVVTQDVRSGAELGLRLLEAMQTLNWEQLGLPADTGVRVGLHTGPVFRGVDPVLRRGSFFGSHVSRAARIEAVTVPGCAFASEQFAACLSLEAPEEFACEYLGLHYLRRTSDRCPLYRVVRR